MLHDGYAERFRAAEKATKPWGVQHGLAFDLLRGIDASLAYNTLTSIRAVVDSPALAQFTYEDIRTHCAEIHHTLFLNQLHFRYPCVLTVGDVEFAGTPEYGASYEDLHEELRGARRSSTSPYRCHVWLTFPDMHIVDVSFFVYRFYDRVAENSRWSDYIVCSDPRHRLAADMPLRYLPMLVGERCVRALVDIETFTL